MERAPQKIDWREYGYTDEEVRRIVHFGGTVTVHNWGEIDGEPASDALVGFTPNTPLGRANHLCSESTDDGTLMEQILSDLKTLDIDIFIAQYPELGPFPTVDPEATMEEFCLDPNNSDDVAFWESLAPTQSGAPYRYDEEIDVPRQQ